MSLISWQCHGDVVKSPVNHGDLDPEGWHSGHRSASLSIAQVSGEGGMCRVPTAVLQLSGRAAAPPVWLIKWLSFCCYNDLEAKIYRDDTSHLMN